MPLDTLLSFGFVPVLGLALVLWTRWFWTRAIKEMRREHAQKFADRCFDCGLARALNTTVPPHACIERPWLGDLSPAAGSEGVPADADDA